MPIEFHCTQCNRLLRTPDNSVGKQAKCPECGTVLTVPNVQASIQAPSPIVETGNPYQVTGHVTEQSPSREHRRGAPPASRGLRFVGALIDGFLVLAIAIPVVILYFAIAQPNMNDDTAGLQAQLVALLATMPINIIQWYLIATSGQSIGKKVVKTRIVDNDNGSNPGFVRAVILRSWVVSLISSVPCLGGIFGLVDILWIFGEEKRCLHDLMANTRVIDA